MLDFTSSLYLGLWHASHTLRPWSQLTTGKPAALAEAEAAQAVAQQLARLQGCEQAALSPSTLHIFWDVFGLLAKHDIAIYVDEGTYPIARWGVERAQASGRPVRRFPHHNAGALRQLLAKQGNGQIPVVVCDGLCPCCGALAPIQDYLEAVREANGWLVIDDTQALGLIGTTPTVEAPYGRGGGGVLRRANLLGPDILLVASLAKSFGVPMAVLSSSDTFIRHFVMTSETRLHCSPPSAADIHAAMRALAFNARAGDTTRAQLAGKVSYFRHQLAHLGLTAQGGLFPMQTITGLRDARRIHNQLERQGVRVVLRQGKHPRTPHLSFILTARHTHSAIERALQALAGII